MRVIAIIIAILGLAGLVFGILLVTQAASAEQEVADSLTAPVTLDTLDATYDGINAKVKQMPQTDPQYLTYFAQRTSLGLARSNVGTASLARTSGVVDIIMGLGLLLAGIALLRKSQSAA
jgi:hypothetical protein